MCAGREREVREITGGGGEVAALPRSKVGAERWAVSQTGKVGRVSRTGRTVERHGVATRRASTRQAMT